MRDIITIYEKLKQVIEDILNCEDLNEIINFLPVYNNYFGQFLEIINDNYKESTQNDKELIMEIISLNKKMQLFFEERKNELEKIISKKGLKRKLIAIYNPYFKGDTYIKDV